MYYNSQKQEGMTFNENETIPSDYIEKYNKISEEKIAISNSIIVYDLIKKTNENKLLVPEMQN